MCGAFSLILYQVKTLVAVVWELLVAGQKRQMLSDGVGDNYMVAGITMVLSRIQSEVCIGISYMSSKRNKLYFQFILHKSDYILSSFPLF